jgi:tetratricopeptide (TPR) repeat protein
LVGTAHSEDLRQDCLTAASPDAGIAACTRYYDSPGLAIAYKVLALQNRSRWHVLSEQYDVALADLIAAENLFPADKPHAGLLAARSRIYVFLGDIPRALSTADEAILYDSNSSPAYLARGMVQFEAGQPQLSMADLNRAIELDPKNADAFRARAATWRKLGKFDDALKDISIATNLRPSFYGFYICRGEIHREKGDLDLSLADISRAVELAPGYLSFSAHSALGTISRYRGELDKSVSSYQRAQQIRPDYLPAINGLGLTFEKMGKLEEAKGQFEGAVKSNSPLRFAGVYKAAVEEAAAHLAALNAGVLPPKILQPPIRATSSTAIPTNTIAVPELTGTKPLGLRRVALVIGNSAYRNVPALANPEKDATVIAATLRKIGFQVVALTNASHDAMITSLREFTKQAQQSDWAMMYYAGHGMEVAGVNYLIPIDARISTDRDVQLAAVPLSQVLEAADAAKKIKLVMLDACRDNPFKPAPAAGPQAVAAGPSITGAPVTTRSTDGRGLAEVKVSGATLVVYAAKDGQVALDGEGGNSPFAVAVVQRLVMPGVEINKMFRLVRDDVMEATAVRQEPFTYGSLPGKEDFYFVER